MALPSAHHRETKPEAVGLNDPDRVMTWFEIDETLNRAVNGLLRSALGSARRIAVFAENSTETLLAHVAGMLAGCSVVPVNFHLTADEVAYILGDSATALLFVGPETIERGLDAAATSDAVSVIGWRSGDDLASRSGTQSWETWLAAQPDDPPPDDVSPRPNLLYTSGTTGFPKGVEEPPGAFRPADTVAEHIKLLGDEWFSAFDSCLVIGPLYHAGPLHLASSALSIGHRVSILGRFDAEATLAAIDRDRPQSSVMVPTHFVKLLALPEPVRARYDVSSLKLVAQTGASCPVPVKRAMIDWFGPIFFEGYGATEAGIVTAIGSEEWLSHPGSVGKCVPPYEVLVLDDAGHELPAATEGRLFFRDTTGRGIIYHGQPESTAAAHVAPGVFTLGEIGRVDPDGYVYITDRGSDMVVSGGVNIYPAEMERVMIDHAAVSDVAGIGIPHPEMGEALLALVVPAEGASPDPAELMTFCRNRLAHYKCPRSIELVASVGRDPMGKLNKRTLRRPYWPTERTIG